MAYELWSQDNFSKGELSPFMYARAGIQQYYNGMKTAQNVLTYPTGAAGKRFGTLYQAILGQTFTPQELYFNTFQYLDQCIYQLVFTPLNIAIYLEGVLIASVITTLDGPTVYNITSTVLGSTFRITAPFIKPFDLTRTSLGPNVITNENVNLFWLTAPTLAGLIVPIQFTTTGTLPVTSPQIKIGVTYFGLTSYDGVNYYMAVFPTAPDAKANTNQFTISSIGTGTNSILILNDWSFTNTVFSNLPFFDFYANYDNLTFTPSATSGTGVTITVSSALSTLTTAFIGGAFIGNGGTSRITGVASTTSFTVSVQEPFDNTSAIQGSLALLAEPAWSDTRGWPQVCSSYQNRALFANTESLPNGFYASVINEYPNFGNLTNDDDDAISWYPSSDNVNVIRFIVPYRSITVHTNTGIYSSPLSDIAAITPSTFTLQLQDSTPASVLTPQAIDNQIIVLSGNDAHTMLWDGINNAYTSNIISVMNEQLIRDPVDETPYADLRRAGSRYVFVINSNGSMAVYQTLMSESVSGWTPQIMEQSYGSAKFIQAGSSADGRAWFVVAREIATASAPIAITAYTPHVAGPPIVLSTLTAVASNFSTTIPTAITFTTTGTLPATVPALQVGKYYWVIGVSADRFNVYIDQADALAGVNSFNFTSAGTNSNVVPWPLVQKYTLEELTEEVFLDCAFKYTGPPASTVTTGSLFNAQSVKMVGDGFGFEAIGVNNQIIFEAHGNAVPVSEAFIGFPINTIIEPMPLTAPPGPNTTLTKPKHIRSVRFMFNNTIGGTINGVPIALNPFNQANIGQPPFPARGIFEMSIMKGWDDFNQPTFTIQHNEPFNIQLLGAFYSVEF